MNRKIRKARAQSACEQRGAALIVALLVVAMVVLLATALSSNFLTMFRRVENQLYSEQAYAYLRGAEALSRAALIYDLQQDDTKYKTKHNDNLNEDWAQAQQYPTDYGWIGGQLEDLQGRFNINQLGVAPAGQGQTPPPPGTYTAAQKQFIRLLLTLKLEEPLSVDQAQAITDAVIDWIDTDDNVSNLRGAESQFYESADPPGRPANRTLVAPSELMFVHGMTPEIYRALVPLITVWPAGASANAGGFAINVNTAPEEVLRSLGPADSFEPFSETEIGPLLEARKLPKYIEDVAHVETLLSANASAPTTTATGTSAGTGKLAGAELTVSSDYFLLNTVTDFQGHRYSMRSILHRNETGKKNVDVIARTVGDW